MYNRRLDSGAEKHPNAGMSVDEESCLPSHPLYRPELQGIRPPLIALPTPQRRGQRMNKAQILGEINSKLEEIIEDLSSRGKFLPCDVVRGIASNLIRMAENRHQCRISWKELSAYNDFSKCHGRIEELIRVYCLFTPFTTLHELGIALAQSESVANFEDLHLGPLIKHPKVMDLFKPPDDLDSPPEITVYQLHGYLFNLIDKSKRHAKFDLEEYLEFVRKKLGLESVQHLCVRIGSFPLLIRV